MSTREQIIYEEFYNAKTGDTSNRYSKAEVDKHLALLLLEIRRLAESDSLPQRVIRLFDQWDKAATIYQIQINN